MNDQSKVTADHLHRDAYLYVRQSSLYQVANNTESSRRQYDLRGRAVALGWPAERVIVIDVDQGQSGASATDREGFQRLVADVGLGKAGIVLGLECSRLARNNADWHRLLELCSLSRTLICDEDGLYDPGQVNDRLLLGLKGTISEAELHFIRARLQGGLLAKAARGELRVRLPVGLVYDQLGNVTLDPDAEVRGAVAHLFKSFQQTGSAHAVVKQFAAEQLTFPGRHSPGGPHAGETYWKALRHDLVLFTLHNPRYAGAYFYGRRKQLTDIDGHTRTVHKPRDQWTVLIPDAHPGYISLQQYEQNQATARDHCGHGRRRPQLSLDPPVIVDESLLPARSRVDRRRTRRVDPSKAADRRWAVISGWDSPRGSGRVAGGIAAPGSHRSRRDSLPSPGSSDLSSDNADPAPVREQAGLSSLQPGPPRREPLQGPQPSVLPASPAPEVGIQTP